MITYRSVEELAEIKKLSKGMKKRIWDAECKQATACRPYPVRVKLTMRGLTETLYVSKDRKWDGTRYQNQFKLLDEKGKAITVSTAFDNNDMECGYFPLSVAIIERAKEVA